MGNDIRFCVTWAKKPKPKTRYFRLWSGAEDAPDGQIRLTLQQPRSPRSLNALPFPEYSEATNQRLSIRYFKIKKGHNGNIVTLRTNHASFSVICVKVSDE